MPPSPWRASTRMAQTSVENLAFRSATSLKRHELDAGHDGREGLAVLFFCGSGDSAHGAAVEAVFEGEELCAEVDAFAASEAGVGASELEGGFVDFRTAVGEEGAIHAGGFGEAQREGGLALVVIEVGGVDELAALFRDGVLDGGVGVAEGVDADAAE